MKRFYLLRRTSEPAILGVRDGMRQASLLREGFQDPAKFDNLVEKLGSNKYYEIRDTVGHEDFEIQCARMLPKAKLTEFLGYGPLLHNSPFLVSAKVAEVFSGFALQPHRLFPAKVQKGGDWLSYFLFYLFPVEDSYLDFPNSVFLTKHLFFGGEPVTFASAEERTRFMRTHVCTFLKTARLTHKAWGLDLFALGAELFISDRLKEALETEGLASGANILPAFGEVSWTAILE
jgi:hypothetical protein